MHPRINELFRYLDTTHDELRTVFESVPREKRAVRPSPNSWSPNDVVAHLTLVERRLAGAIGKLIADARANGLRAESDDSPILPGFGVERLADRTVKITAPSGTDPMDFPEALGWADYEQARASVKQAALQGDGLALGDATYPHPRLGTLTIYQYIAFVGAHEARHVAQIREMTEPRPSA